MRRQLLGAFLLASAMACNQTTSSSATLEVTMAASRVSVPPGDTVTFVVNAQGNSLVGLEMDFGDTGTDQYATGGARTARVTFRHAYSARGTFRVRVVVTDAVAGQKDASVEILVN